MLIEKFKNFAIIFLSILVFALGYFIFTGKFCHCSSVTCPVNNDNMRSFYT